MKIKLARLTLVGTNVYTPEEAKGETNPYTTGEESWNPYVKDWNIEIRSEDYQELLQFLEEKKYDVSAFQKRQ